MRSLRKYSETERQRLQTCQKRPATPEDLKPHFENVQSHYDLSDEFFRLFLDPTQTYSCAYFERDDMTLEEAQIAKIDLSLGKLDLQPGMTLLDVGCGWGATMMRAIEKYDVNVVGLTLSKNQQAYVEQKFAESDSPRTKRVFLEGWEQFHEPVDRIVSIGAFEHFGADRYDDFFKKTYQALPADGRMLLHTIVKPSDEEFRGRGLKLTMRLVRYIKFIMDEIFPGGELPRVALVEEHATKVGFEVSRVQSLRLHYAKTLDIWATALEARKDEAIAIQSEEVYDRYMKYLTGCADLFREGYTDICQFTLDQELASSRPPPNAKGQQPDQWCPLAQIIGIAFVERGRVTARLGREPYSFGAGRLSAPLARPPHGAAFRAERRLMPEESARQRHAGFSSGSVTRAGDPADWAPAS